MLKKKINRLEDYEEPCGEEKLKEKNPNKFLNRKRGLRKLKLRNNEEKISPLKNKFSHLMPSNFLRLENKVKQLNEIKNEIPCSGLNKNLITLLNELYDILNETEDKGNIYSVSIYFKIRYLKIHLDT